MDPESETCSMKVLLKQVYGFHNSRIKNLEDEIEELKKNLYEAELKLKNYESECKRCKELEAAFNSCKTALHEQSKWFENLGQKFSNLQQTGKKIKNEKTAKETVDSGRNYNEESNSQVVAVKKMDLSANSKTHFLKNIMSLSSDDFQESLDLSAPLQTKIHQDYSTLIPDSLILVPNTVDMVNGVEMKDEQNGSIANELPQILLNGNKICDDQLKGGVNPKEFNPRVQNKDQAMKDTQNGSKANELPPQILLNGNKIGDDQTQGGGLNLKEFSHRVQSKDRARKRLSEDSVYSELSLEKPVKENNLKPGPTNKKLKTSVKASSDANDGQCAKKQAQNQAISPKENNSKNENGLSTSNSLNKNSIPALNIEIHKINQDVITEVYPLNNTINNNTSNDETLTKNDSFQATVSPSLIPLSEKTNIKVVNNPQSSSEDINDFQLPVSSKKTSNDSGSWTSCDKRKLSKKVLNLKPIKSSSKFKLQLDSLPPNFKKPNYRQTKLSKSIFISKPSSQNKQDSDLDSDEVEEIVYDFKKDSPPDLQVSSYPVKTPDFDATFIPDNYEYEVISSGNSSVKPRTSNHNDFEKRNLIVKDFTDESDEENSPEIIIKKPSTSLKKEKVGSVKSKHVELNELGNSFDRLPKKPEPDYKYKEETVRKKSERKQLTAFDCNECEKYYSELGLSDEEKQKRMHKCSRHRSKFAPPPTPAHFWELEFPDTQECKARGYLNETQKVKLKSHRKRPL